VTADEPVVDRATVLALLNAAGITAPDADVTALASGYAASRRMMASLYAMPGVRYEVPATTFDPRVTSS
jgi:hypothetical protein